MLKRIDLTLMILVIVVVWGSSALALNRPNFWAGVGAVGSNPLPETDRERDGLNGPVRRVRTETAKLTNKGGRVAEGPRAALEVAAYDIKGSKVENAYFPVAGATLTGKEVYKYDDKGNIVEMTLQDETGALLSKEVYSYEFDAFGNWTKMTTSVAVIEGGKINFEPTEITYRTITYYLDEATLARLSQPSAPKSTVVPQAPAPSSTATTANSLTTPSVALNNVVSKSTTDASLMTMAAPTEGNSSTVAKGAHAPEPAAGNGANGSSETARNQAQAKPPVKPISGGVLNGRATSLPVPVYPAAARNARAFGQVTVEVVIDGSGKVISAKAISGNSLLQQAAVQAAYLARFTPTLLSGQPVKISGVINYNFSLQ